MKIIFTRKSKTKFFSLALVVVLFWAGGTKNIFAQKMEASDKLVNITEVASPLTLPAQGGLVTFVYKVVNLGTTPLSNVRVTDNKCSAMSNELGDTNGNHLLDRSEVWIYNCTANIRQTSTSTATVTAFANSLNAVGADMITINVATTGAAVTPNFPNEDINSNMIPGLPNNGPNPGLPNGETNSTVSNITLSVWGILGGILVALIIVLFLIRKKR